MPNVSPQRGAVSQCGTRCVRRLRCGPPQHHDSHVVSGRKRVHEAAPSKRPERTDHKLARTGNGGVAAGSMLGRRRAGRDLVLRACCSWVDGDGRAEAICQIPRRMKIVYTQGCSFGPERDNQLSYTRTSRDGAAIEALSRVPWLPSERSETVEMQHIDHVARRESWRREPWRRASERRDVKPGTARMPRR